jgi:hypothetical protein
VSTALPWRNASARNVALRIIPKLNRVTTGEMCAGQKHRLIVKTAASSQRYGIFISATAYRHRVSMHDLLVTRREWHAKCLFIGMMNPERSR